MVSTRSAGTKRTISQAFQPAKVVNASQAATKKAAAATTTTTSAPAAASPSPAKKARKAKKEEEVEVDLPLLSESEVSLCTTIAMPSLPFDLAHGKDHLIAADVRFRRLVERIPLRVFEDLSDGSSDGGKELNLFRTLVTSILGQQVSWLAARAILYKFTRIWFPDLPEKPDFKTMPRDSLPFPTPLQVRSASEATLRSAGLSGQKVRYVSDIAQRFSDGRLDVRKIVAMEDEEEVVRTLVAIKGVGVWTAQMLLIFALRRPDVLPVGDLGVQKGMVLLWASGAGGPAIKSAKALPEEGEEASKVLEAVEEGEEPLPSKSTASALPALDVHTQEPKPAVNPPTLPASSGLTASSLNARKNGTKTKGNVYLSPGEMEILAETWKPYRSLASVYMWALVDA